MKYFIFVIAAAFILFPCLIFANNAGLFLTSEERQLSKQIAHLPNNKSVPLGQLSILKQYDTLCIIDAYAVRGGARREESLNRIFGHIDYSSRRDEIIKTYSDHDTSVGFYPVVNGKLLPSIPVFYGPHTYIKPGRHRADKGWRYFPISHCYKPNDICFQRTSDDQYGWHQIIIDFCNELKTEE